jgi:hypothetical protein
MSAVFILKLLSDAIIYGCYILFKEVLFLDARKSTQTCLFPRVAGDYYIIVNFSAFKVGLICLLPTFQLFSTA